MSMTFIKNGQVKNYIFSRVNNELFVSILKKKVFPTSNLQIVSVKLLNFTFYSGKVLRCAWDLKPQTWQLLKMKEKFKGLTQFSNRDWLSDFAFMVNLFWHIK